MISNPSADHQRHIPLEGLANLSELQGEDEEDTQLLREQAQTARGYIATLPWCVVVLDGYFAGGVGGVFTIFLFHIVPTRPEIDDWMWVVVGDIPSAYLPLEDAPNPREVFQSYCEGIEWWSEWVRSGTEGPPDDVPPLDVPPTASWADFLEKRAQSLKHIIGPVFGVSSAT
jgi:hypothetical protein